MGPARLVPRALSSPPMPRDLRIHGPRSANTTIFARQAAVAAVNTEAHGPPASAPSPFPADALRNVLRAPPDGSRRARTDHAAQERPGTLKDVQGGSGARVRRLRGAYTGVHAPVRNIATAGHRAPPHRPCITTASSPPPGARPPSSGTSVTGRRPAHVSSMRGPSSGRGGRGRGPSRRRRASPGPGRSGPGRRRPRSGCGSRSGRHGPGSPREGP